MFWYDLKKLRRAVVILMIICACLFSLISCALIYEIKDFTTEYAPDWGIWYCDELDLELNYMGGLSYLNTKTEPSPCINWNPESKHVLIYHATDTIDLSFGRVYDNKVYAPYMLYLSLYYVDLDDDTYILKDETGKEYIFYRVTG